MNTAAIINAYLDHKPIGGTPLSNALLMQGQRISPNVCLVKNVLYKKERDYVYGQYINDDRSFAEVSGIPAALATHIWYLFKHNFTLGFYESHMTLPYYDWVITLLESHKCIYKIEDSYIYLYAISHSAANTVATEVSRQKMILDLAGVYEPIETATDFKYPGLLWAMEAFLSRPGTDFNKALFEGVAASYCALSGASINVDYYAKSFVVRKGIIISEHKCYRVRKGVN